MRVDLRQIEALHWIARLGSFRAAAEHLHISQPSLSARIRQLEDSLQITLFDRSSYRAKLTTRGRELAQDAERLHRMALAMESRVRRVAALWGTIRLGVCDSFALACLPELLTRIDRRFPEVQVELDVDHSANLMRKLGHRKLEVAFLSLETPTDGVVIERLGMLRMAWVTGAKTRLPDRPLRPEDIAELPLLTTPPPSLLYENIVDWFEAAGVEPRRLSICNSLSIMARIAASGYGAALLPVATIRRELTRRQLRLLPTDPAMAPHPLAVAYAPEPGGPDLTIIRDLAHEAVAVAKLDAN